MKKPFDILQILLTCLLMISACTEENRETHSTNSVIIPDVIPHTTLSNNAQVRTEWETPKGIGIGYVWPHERDLPPGQRTQTSEISLNIDEAFAPYLILVTPKQQNVLVTALLNFQQIEFELDGQYGLLHEVSIDPEGYLELPMQITIEEPGLHELIILAFADPYNSSLDTHERMSSFGDSYVGRRALITVGEDNTIAKMLPTPLTGDPIPDHVMLGLDASFASHTEKENLHPGDRQLYVAEAKPDEEFKYDIWVSNFNGEAGSDYALIMFHNFHQVPINGNDVTMVHLEPNEEIIISTSQKMAKDPGVNQMQIIHIFDPYHSILDEEVRAPYVFGSPRPAINTQ